MGGGSDANVLAAVAPQMDEALRALVPRAALRFVRTLEEARAEARGRRYDLAVIGLSFDESRMVDLLVFLRSLDAYRNVPIVCVQDANARLPLAAFRVVDVAIRALGGRAFIDLRPGSPGWHDGRALCASLLPPRAPRPAGLAGDAAMNSRGHAL